MVAARGPATGCSTPLRVLQSAGRPDRPASGGMDRRKGGSGQGLPQQASNRVVVASDATVFPVPAVYPASSSGAWTEWTVAVGPPSWQAVTVVLTTATQALSCSFFNGKSVVPALASTDQNLARSLGRSSVFSGCTASPGGIRRSYTDHGVGGPVLIAFTWLLAGWSVVVAPPRTLCKRGCRIFAWRHHGLDTPCWTGWWFVKIWVCRRSPYHHQ